jgi:LytS/YehU family sensor histidine kinase
LPGESLQTELAPKALQTGEIQIALRKDELLCKEHDCPLGAGILVPFHQAGTVAGLIALYFRRPQQIRKIEVALARGLGKLISNQLNLAFAENMTNLMRDAELRVLQAQINPHFLFNTLNSIKWMAAVNGAENVSNMIAALGSLLEATLGRKKELITLADEFNCLQNYVLLQKMRFGDKFDIVIQAQETILDYKVPQLILQPIVENSIIHGFEDMDSGGLITVKADQFDDCLLIEIQDNGKGMDPKTAGMLLSDINEQKGRFSNIGLKNVHDRIKLRYGPGFGLDVTSEKSKGTLITVKLPSKKEDNQVAENTYC